jgi:hypothetical protein
MNDTDRPNFVTEEGGGPYIAGGQVAAAVWTFDWPSVQAYAAQPNGPLPDRLVVGGDINEVVRALDASDAWGRIAMQRFLCSMAVAAFRAGWDAAKRGEPNLPESEKPHG